MFPMNESGAFVINKRTLLLFLPEPLAGLVVVEPAGAMVPPEGAAVAPEGATVAPEGAAVPII